MSDVKKSLVLSFSSKYAQLAISFFSSLIIARLLGPEEVGLYSVVAGIVVVAHMLRDFGVSSYIIKEDNFTDEKCCAAFIVTAGLSWLAAGLLFVSAPYLVEFFAREEVLIIVRVLTINFIIIPFGSISLSLLRKNMNFNALLIINVSSAMVNAISTIVLAYLGYSFMSLVWSSVAGTLVTVVLSSYYRQKIKIILPKISTMKNVFVFGGQVSITQMMNTTIGALPEILVGKYIGVNVVGLMSRAKGLTQLFHYGVTQAILPVLLPDLVNKNASGEGNAQRRYLDTMSMMCSIGWPFFILLAFVSDNLIVFLFGETWQPAAPYVIWFSIIAIISLAHNLAGELFIALDQPKKMLQCRSFINALGLVVMLVMINFGIIYFLIGLIFIQLLSLVISQYYLDKYCNLLIMDWLKALKLPFLLVVMITVILFGVKKVLTYWQLHDFFVLSIYSLSMFVCWLTVIVLTESKLKAELKRILVKT